MRYYIADFETTVPDTENDSIEELTTRVWSWGVCELDSPESFTYGTTIESFIEWCSKVKKRKVYFHNLKFDGKFLIDYLLKSGYVYDDTRKLDKSFNCLISEYGQFYSIEIIFKAYEKDWKHTVFYDSSKKIPLSVAQVSKSFNLPIVKGSIDYKKDRPVGYEPTQDELLYLKNDCVIMGEALHIQHSQGLERMTVGGDALFHYKTLVGKNFKKWFPNTLDSKGMMFLDLKLFYRGGFTYVKPSEAGKEIGQGMTYDVNSLYPSVMKNELLPYGQPIFFNGKYNEEYKDIYPLYCQTIVVEFTLKKNHIPFVNDKTGYMMKTIDYLKETKPFQPLTLFLTNIELELFYEHYNIIEIRYNGGYMFQGANGMFDQYIDYWMERKEEASKTDNAGLRQISKLMLNSLYGKFGKNIFMGGKIPVLDEEQNKVVYQDKPVTIEKGVYMPIAIFVTSYARHKMISSAQSVYDRFIYCDTDSLHIHGTKEPDTIEIDKYKLGAWKYEGTFKKARFLRAKAYIHYYREDKKIRDRIILVKEKLLVKCSGMSDSIKKQVKFHNFHFGFTAQGKKVPKTINGGVVLVDTTYTLME
jgi:hypothetical protein